MALDGKIYLSPPDVGPSEDFAVLRALSSGWVAPLGPELDRFEDEVAKFAGASNVVALSSGTAALHLALEVVGVQPGDVVVTSTMTFVATPNAISYVGGVPPFVDCLEDGTPDPDLIQVAIESAHSDGLRVGAIVTVDVYGRMADYKSILAIGQAFKIPVVADSAEAMGASRDGYTAGNVGSAGIFSFNGNKIMTTSGGGMLLTSDPQKADYVRYLATQAREPTVHYEHVELGYNYRMSSVCAALGRAQLSRLPEMIARRRTRRRQYQTYFAEVPGVSLLPGNVDEDNCWLSSILVDESVSGWSPLALQQYLEGQNIETRPLWKPMHLQPLYRDARFVGGDVAERLFHSGLALPSGSSMSDAEMDRVLREISTFLRST